MRKEGKGGKSKGKKCEGLTAGLKRGTWGGRDCVGPTASPGEKMRKLRQ